jgi:exo-beta-1,3-glucanase (GH17 family)
VWRTGAASGNRAYALTALFLVFCLAVSVIAWSVTAVDTAPAAGGSTRYFAEGYTGAGFQEYIALANRSAVTAQVLLRFLFNDGPVHEEHIEVPAGSRSTVNVNRTVGENREVSVVVESDVSDFAVERPIYFEYRAGWKGGHTVFGASKPSRTWYFAEGYTGPGFDEYICVLNPGQTPASMTLRFQTSSMGEVTKSGLVLAAGSRSTFKVNDLLGPDIEASFKVESDQPVVAERPMYFDYLGRDQRHWKGGSCVVGTPTLSRDHYFAEGTTRSGFEQWLTLQNPTTEPIVVDAVYQLGQGQGDPVHVTYPVDPRTRRTIFVPDEVGPSRDVSVHLSCPHNFLAERPMYFHFEHSGLLFQGGNSAMGAFAPRSAWFFAEGYTGASFEEWLTLQNISDSASEVVVRYLPQESAALPPRRHEIPPHSRVTIFVNEDAGPGYQVAADLRVVSGPDVVVERPTYFDPFLWPLPVSTDTNVLYGLCFSPYLFSDPRSGGVVTREEIHRLVNIVTPYTHWVRTFGAQGDLSYIPPLAKEHSLGVAAGCDIYTDRTRNELEVEALIGEVRDGYVDIAVVGDEALALNAVTEGELIDYIRRVKAAGVPTGTSDTWEMWLSHPDLIAECDVVLVNIYPFWEGIAVENALAHLISVIERVRAVAGGKRMIIETGWPSGGQTVGLAVPGFENQARYVSDFISWAHTNNLEYFYFEAFNEDWKRSVEGPCGACWGAWDSSGNLKQPLGQVIAPKF